MKKYLLTFSLIAGIVLISCKNESGLSSTAQKNKEANAAIVNAYQTGDFSKISEYIAADAVVHAGGILDIKGLDSIVMQMKRSHEMTPDMKHKLIHEVATDEYVYYWAEITGTMRGRPIKMSGVDITKYKDGKAIEFWTFMDAAEVMQMRQDSRPPDTLVTEMNTLKKK